MKRYFISCLNGIPDGEIDLAPTTTLELTHVRPGDIIYSVTLSESRLLIAGHVEHTVKGKYVEDNVGLYWLELPDSLVDRIKQERKGNVDSWRNEGMIPMGLSEITPVSASLLDAYIQSRIRGQSAYGKFNLGSLYSRQKIRTEFGIQAATLLNGVYIAKQYGQIWLFVTQEKNPTITRLFRIGEEIFLRWPGQAKGRTDKDLIAHRSEGLQLLVFYRNKKNSYINTSFQFIGEYEYYQHSKQPDEPTLFTFRRVDPLEKLYRSDEEAREEEQGRAEGQKEARRSAFYERDPKLKARVVRAKGFSCEVCSFNFADFYGTWGEGYIEAHHVIPISSPDRVPIPNPRTDMAVVCSNCHRMIHRRKGNALSVSELRGLIAKNRGQ